MNIHNYRKLPICSEIACHYYITYTCWSSTTVTAVSYTHWAGEVAAGELRQDKYQSIVLYKVVMSDNVPHFFQLERSGNGHKQAVWC